MLRHIPSLITLLVFGAAGCSSDRANWATFEVGGTVRDSQSQPVPVAEVRVATWAPGECGGPSSLWQLAITSTNTNGQYRVRLTSLTSSYTACIRVTAGSVSRDTTIFDKPATAPVAVDVVVP